MQLKNRWRTTSFSVPQKSHIQPDHTKRIFIARMCIVV